MSTFEEQFDRCCAEIAKRMRVCTVAAGFQVIESPTADGSFLKVWPPKFQTRRAAELYVEIARVWGSLEQQGVANPRELARTFCARWPVYLHWLRPLH